MDPSIPPYARTQSHLFARSHLRLGRWALGLRKPLSHFRLITEFGSGSAEMAHVARGLGFRGLFLIYDLPPMLLLQRYWLRLAGLPAYLLHHDVAPAMLRMPPGGSPAAAATPCVLVSSLHTDASTGEMLLPIALRAIAKSVNVESVSSAQHRHQASDHRSVTDSFGHALRQVLLEAIFVGFNSFTEASPATRNALLPLLPHYGAIVIVFAPHIQGWNNLAFLSNMVRSMHLLDSHTVCAWRPLNRVGGGWLVATHKARAEQVRCVVAAGCSEGTRLDSIPQNCLSV